MARSLLPWLAALDPYQRQALGMCALFGQEKKSRGAVGPMRPCFFTGSHTTKKLFLRGICVCRLTAALKSFFDLLFCCSVLLGLTHAVLQSHKPST